MGVELHDLMNISNPLTFRVETFQLSLSIKSQLNVNTVKTRIKEPPDFGVRLAKVLKLWSFNRTFCPNCR